MLQSHSHWRFISSHTHIFGSSRSIANRGFAEVLILRMTDGGSHCDDHVNKAASSTAMSAIVSSGLQQMGSLVSSFRSGSSNVTQ